MPTQTTHAVIIPGLIFVMIWNQFKPVLKADFLQKMIKIHTLITKLTNFWLDFLKYFYIFRIVSC